MHIEISPNSITNKGLYHRTKTINKMTGHACINKVVRILNDFDYYPFKNESSAAIENELKKSFVGRSFSIFEKDHGHQEGAYYILNRITVKDAIDEKDKDKFLKQGYFEKPVGGVMSYDEFMATYNNEAYATMDVSELDKNGVEETIKREHLY